MTFCWQELMELLPPWMRTALGDALRDKPVTELRLRLGAAPQLVGRRGEWYPSPRLVGGGDISFVVNTASRFSAYAAQSLCQGFLTARGGHRIGLSGQWVVRDGQLTGLQQIQSLCIRIARDVGGLGEGTDGALEKGSVLLFGPPGSGKTTLLRDMVRYISDGRREQVSVIDQREELFPMHYGGYYFPCGSRTDVLTGVPKDQGMEIAVRTLNPAWVAVDEITSPRDCAAMERSARCGVRFLATAHGDGLEDLRKRPMYRSLMQAGIFAAALVLKRDGSYTVEELTKEW